MRIQIVVDEELGKKVEAMAKWDGRSVSAWCRKLIESQCLMVEGEPEKPKLEPLEEKRKKVGAVKPSEFGKGFGSAYGIS